MFDLFCKKEAFAKIKDLPKEHLQRFGMAAMAPKASRYVQ